MDVGQFYAGCFMSSVDVRKVIERNRGLRRVKGWEGAGRWGSGV